jgi:LuxR family maltose regulon positive regulatory protein
MLDALEKANQFVIPLDDERCWYRYHHLFADLLEQHLRLYQGDRVSELHRRASQWFAKNGFKNDAVDHAFAAQDYTQAAQLIEEIAEVDWDRAGESRLLQWLNFDGFGKSDKFNKSKISNLKSKIPHTLATSPFIP